ncbi:MAG: hypothetical protein M1828_000544 [Chrysothrix sp. TS-e1954]|nr:MAG: hypothetical protein M1828_000544 [Chrysothrix sp. TS-e1954]
MAPTTKAGRRALPKGSSTQNGTTRPSQMALPARLRTFNNLKSRVERRKLPAARALPPLGDRRAARKPHRRDPSPESSDGSVYIDSSDSSEDSEFEDRPRTTRRRKPGSKNASRKRADQDFAAETAESSEGSENVENADDGESSEDINSSDSSETSGKQNRPKARQRQKELLQRASESSDDSAASSERETTPVPRHPAQSPEQFSESSSSEGEEAQSSSESQSRASSAYQRRSSSGDSEDARPLYDAAAMSKWFIEKAVERCNPDNPVTSPPVPSAYPQLFPLYYDAVRRMNSPLDFCILTAVEPFFVHRSVVFNFNCFEETFAPFHRPSDGFLVHPGSQIETLYMINEESHAFPALIEFMYSGDYSELNNDFHRRDRKQSYKDSCVIFHAEVFTLAAKYGMANLKDLSARKFNRTCEPLLILDDLRAFQRHSPSFLQAAKLVYNTLPADARTPIKEIIVDKVCSLLPHLLDERTMRSMKADEDAENAEALDDDKDVDWTEDDYRSCERAMETNRVLIRNMPELMLDILRYSYPEQYTA